MHAKTECSNKRSLMFVRNEWISVPFCCSNLLRFMFFLLKAGMSGFKSFFNFIASFSRWYLHRVPVTSVLLTSIDDEFSIEPKNIKIYFAAEIFSK